MQINKGDQPSIYTVCELTLRCMIMKQNVGILDTAIRGVIAVICVAVAAEGLFPLAVNITLFVFGLLLWVSCSFGVCFVYKALGLDTYPGAGHGLEQYYPRS
jgi:hypothetical protein